MANLYQLAHELEIAPKELERWLKSRGLGAGKNISSRAQREARAHFRDTADHPMADALKDRDGLGTVARHEELTFGFTLHSVCIICATLHRLALHCTSF